MEILYARCGGLDGHATTVVACLCVEGEQQIRTFSTITEDLLQLADWLLAAGCTHIAVERTGVYWRPVVNLLEDHLTVLLVNAHHIKAVLGWKTDVRDCDWLGDLLRHSLLKASFIPPRHIREWRELTRHRQILGRDRAAVANRIQKLMESANLKLGKSPPTCWAYPVDSCSRRSPTVKRMPHNSRSWPRGNSGPRRLNSSGH